MKTRRNRKWKIPHTLLERWTSYKNHQLKVKLWWVRACQRKKSAIFVTFILFEGFFLNICVLSQCIMYWINFQNIYTFTYSKTLIHTLLLLVFKIVESLQCILEIKILKYLLKIKTASPTNFQKQPFADIFQNRCS